MDWIADPESAGGWLRERMDIGWADMHHYVPHGYPAYARVFHPAEARSLPDGPVPPMEQIVRMPDAEQRALMQRFVDAPARWQDAADAFGTTMHALAQWHRLVRIPAEDDWSAGSRPAPDGREFQPPQEGRMPVETFALVAEQLAAHTTTPDAGYVGVWEGWGGLVGFVGQNPSRTFLGGDDAAHQEMLYRSIHDPFNNVFSRGTWQPGILSDEISKGERLHLPDRDHLLFSAAPSAFAGTDWVLDAPWRDREREQHGYPPSAEHPSLLWPDDRAWVMVSEIDLDSTIVAGPADLVRALYTDERIEALPIREGADLSWDGDDLNR